MSLRDYGARAWASLRALQRDDHGDVICPACGSQIGHSRGDLEIPVARLEDGLQVAGTQLHAGPTEFVRRAGVATLPAGRV